MTMTMPRVVGVQSPSADCRLAVDRRRAAGPPAPVTRCQNGAKNPPDFWEPEDLVRLFAGIRTVGSGAGADREDLGGDGGIGGGGGNASRGEPPR
jgi:hypothetical protein